MTQLDFTVAIPTYNGEFRLPELLERLRLQISIEYLRWEIIVIDNNSTDKTARVVQDYQESWQCPAHLRYFIEMKQGAGYARQRAVREARSPLVGFLDDDNYPALDWVAQACSFAAEMPRAGAIASCVHGKFDIEPPENFERIAPFFAITERGNLPLIYDSRSNLLPPSAGLVVRKQAWSQSVPEETILTGRTLDNNLTSEDLEALSYIQKAGWEIWYNPKMVVDHYIPNWRMQLGYLIPFFEGIGLSRYVIRTLHINPFIKPFAVLVYMLNDMRKLVKILFKYQMPRIDNLVETCEFYFIYSCLISPFYWWSRFKKYGSHPKS